MNMMRFNEGGMTSEMLQQAMEAQAASMGQDITGDSFILTGQYSSPVQQEEDGREYVEYQHPDMQEPVKVYGNWNEYAVSQDENGMMLIGDEDYPIMQDEEGNYVLNEEKFDDQMTAMEERQGAEAMAAEAAQGSTQGASKMENLLEMLQDAQGPQGGGGQYEEGGEVPKYFLGGLFKKGIKAVKNNPVGALGALGVANAATGGKGLLSMGGIGMAKGLIDKFRDRRDNRQQNQQTIQAMNNTTSFSRQMKPGVDPAAAAANQATQAAQAFPGRVMKAGAGNPAQVASAVAGAPQPNQQAPAAVAKQAGPANPRVRASFQYGGVVDGTMAAPMAAPMVDPNAMMAAPMQQPMMGQGQVPVVDPNAAVTNQAAMMAQPQPGVAQMGVMQDGGRVIKAYEDGGEVEGLLTMLDAMPSKPQISPEDIYKKYLKSRDKGSYMQQEGVADIIKEQERIFKQRGNKFSDGTGVGDLFYNNGGKMDEYAYGGRVVKAYENGGKDDEGDPPKINTVSDVDFSDGEFTDFQPAYRTALDDRGREISATSALLSRLNEGRLQTRLVDEEGNPIEDEQDWKRMQERKQEQLREDFKSGKVDAKSFEKQMKILKGEADAFPEYVQAQGKDEATRNIYGKVAERKDPEGHVNEILDRESHWFDKNDPKFGKGGFDVHNPGHVMEYQMMYNQLAAPGKEIKVDGKWGEQTDSARVPIRESEKAELGGGVDPELEMRLFQEKPEDGWDPEPPGGGGPGGGGGGGYTGGKVRKQRKTGGSNCKNGHCSVNWEEGGRVVKYDKGGKFPDLNKDGKITMADILKGRGVKGKYRQGGKVMKYKC